jgi:hypothetical protein
MEPVVTQNPQQGFQQPFPQQQQYPMQQQAFVGLQNQHPVGGYEPVGPYVFALDGVRDDVYGKHLKDYEATGKVFQPVPKWWLANFCSCDTIEIKIKYSFYTEGILEQKKTKSNQCFTCCIDENYTWKFYPRHLIDHVQVDNDKKSRCFGCCDNSFCKHDHTLVDIVNRSEVASGVNDPMATLAGCSNMCGKSSQVALQMNADEAQQFYLFCQNYTYNTNFQASRIYNMEFLKTLGENKYAITPTDWVNYYISHTKGEYYGFTKDAKPVPMGRLNFNRPAGGLGGGAAGGAGGLLGMIPGLGALTGGGGGQ